MKLSRKCFLSLVFFAAALLFAFQAHAQGVGASGDISGTVADPSGAAIPKAKVTATDTAKGLSRTTTTDDRGEYRLSDLAPATYNVSAEAQGFQTTVRQNVILNVGQVGLVDFRLALSEVTQRVEVTAAIPVVETERSHLADTVTDDYIKDLPIDRRDYLTFTLLMPGVSNSTRLAGDQDFRVKQTPQSGLSFYGSNGRGNTVTIDGGEANDDAGGVRLTVSQDDVQEFQINRSNYSAELGGASGAAINIVTKSGSNQLHGSLFGFFRNDALDARDPFAFNQALAPGQPFDPASPDSLGQPVKDTLNRQQFGGSFGMALQPDKTFLFASFEGLRQDAQNAVPLLTDTSIFRPDNGVTTPNNQQAIINGLTAEGGIPVPCLTGRPALPAAVCATELQNFLTISSASTNPLDPFVIDDIENNGGLFPYTTREYLASGRLDHKFSDNNQAYLRYGYGHDREENPDVQSLTGFSRGSAIHTFDSTLQGGWLHIFNSNLQNEAHLQWNYNDFNVIPNEPGQVGLDIPGFANLGTNIFLPSDTILRRYEFADNVTWIRGRHTMKMGVYELIRGDYSDSHTYMPGRFVFGDLPGGILSPCLQVPAACGLSAATEPAAINSLQSASFGLPQFYQQGFGSPTYNLTRPYTAVYWQDTWRVLPNVTLNYGLRYELDSQPSTMNTDKDNFAPRLSVAWDPANDQKTVIRAGVGIFYSPIYAQIPDVVQTLGNINNSRQIALLLVPLTGAPGNPALTSATIFGALAAEPVNPANPNSPTYITCTTPPPGQAACISPAQLTQFGLNVTNSGPLPPAPGAVPLPVIFGTQPDYQNPYSLQGEIGVERQLSNNLSVSATYVYIHTMRLPVALDTNLLPAPVTTVTLANGQTASYRNWNDPQCAVTPTTCFVNPLILQDNIYSSAAYALYQGVSFEVKQRLSHHFMAMANYTYSKAWDTTTDFNSDYAPQDETNLAAEKAPSDFDERNKFVATGVVESPWNNRVLKGFELAPIVNYHSGNPFDLLAGTDVNGDRHYTNDRPIGAGRNTGLGPDYFSLDMRLSRTFRLREKASLQLLAEAFNITNRTNYASVNNVVGPDFGLTPGFTTFNVNGNAALSPTQALGFTSAFPKREIQLGFRLDF
jgi:Carboxypeptidase regulatory-like domain